MWESTYLPLKGGKFHRHLLVNIGPTVIRQTEFITQTAVTKTAAFVSNEASLTKREEIMVCAASAEAREGQGE